MNNTKNNSLDCDIVCDLLPLYHDGIVSEKTKIAVEEHISHCEKCRSELYSLHETIPSEDSPAPVTGKKFRNFIQSQKRKRIIFTSLSVLLAVALLVGGYFGQLQLPIFRVPEQEITVHRVYRYETDEGYKLFMLWSAPHYDYMRLATDIVDDGATLEFRLTKPLISQKHENVGDSGSTEIYALGWSSNDEGGRDFVSIDKVNFAGKTVWTEADAAEPVPEYVYEYEKMNECTGEVTAWITGADEGYVGAVYHDGTTVIWDLDGNIISNNQYKAE